MDHVSVGFLSSLAKCACFLDRSRGSGNTPPPPFYRFRLLYGRGSFEAKGCGFEEGPKGEPPVLEGQPSHTHVLCWLPKKGSRRVGSSDCLSRPHKTWDFPLRKASLPGLPAARRVRVSDAILLAPPKWVNVCLRP